MSREEHRSGSEGGVSGSEGAADKVQGGDCSCQEGSGLLAEFNHPHSQALPDRKSK